MSTDTFAITTIQIIGWIVCGFVVALLIHAVKPSQSHSVAKDAFFATIGSLCAGLTIIFFYGYLLLEVFILSLVAGIILASIYLAVSARKNSTTPASIPPL